LGDALSFTRYGQDLTVRCTNGTVRLSVLAADLIRVRLGRSTDLTTLPSYSVARADAEWAPASFTVAESGDTIDLCTARMTCRIDKRPCRVSFFDSGGRSIHRDTLGMGWHGEQVIRFGSLASDEHLYGLGERAFPLERRGRSYTLWNIDPQTYEPGADPVYLNIPFYIGLQAGQSYGLFYDNSYRCLFDLGQTHPDEAAYVAAGGELCYYFIYGPTPGQVLERYTELTGRLPMPPLWALGYGQSRWSYFPESRVREIARLFREHRIPCDALYIDIHYMDGFRCFTWNSERFPDPAGLLKDLHAAGYKVLLLIDCGIKVDPDYHVCAEGRAQGAFCTYPDGTPAGGPVWPGECYFPDFTMAQVRQWWGGLHAPLVELGVDGVWNDMNEPTIISPQGETLAECVRHGWEGLGSDHAQAHNVYGMLTARATREGLLRLKPHARPFVVTRAGWAGAQRDAIPWTGDNQSTWEHLRLSVAMVLGLGLSGFGFSGADIGGFDGGPEAELLVRWNQLGAFLPFFRNHASLLSPPQEPWAHGEPYLSLNRSAIEMRYRLLPYLYTATWQCAQTGLPIARPLALAYPDDSHALTLDDEFLCGDALLVAPVCEPGAASRQVYVPTGEWFDFWTGQRYSGPQTLTAAAPLERIPLYVRAGAVLPTWPVMQHTANGAPSRLILHVYHGDGESWLYEDDGQSMAYLTGAFRLLHFRCRGDGADAVVACEAQGAYQPTDRCWEWHFHGLAGMPAQVLADEQPVQNLSWDEARHLLRFETDPVQRVTYSRRT